MMTLAPLTPPAATAPSPDLHDSWPELPTWSGLRGYAQEASGPVEPHDALVISDLHLGSENCQAKAINALLEALLAGVEGDPAGIHARTLIINGDVFDSIDFRRLKKTHWKVLSTIRHLSDKLQVIWIAGNHDGSAEIVSHLLGVEVVEEHAMVSGGRRILCVHGHRWDDFIEDHPILTWFADCIYAALQRLDRTHYVARLAKRKSKIFVRCLEKIRRGAVEHARRGGYDAVICGHTHHAATDHVDGTWYYNSGCWTETPCTYITINAGTVAVHAWQNQAAAVAV